MRTDVQLLKLLAAHEGDAVPEDRIAAFLWGERPPRDIRGTLNTYVSVLRYRGTAIVADVDGYRLEAAPA